MGQGQATGRRPGDEYTAPDVINFSKDGSIIRQLSEDGVQVRRPSIINRAQFEPIQPSHTRIKTKSGRSLSQPTVPVLFCWDSVGQEAREVFLACSNDNWTNRLKLVKSKTNFYGVINLPEGVHQYKFLVDGEWRHDPLQPSVPNSLGSVNNVIEVKKSDFDWNEALAADLQSMEKRTRPHHHSTVSGEPPGSYGQVFPSRLATERSTSGPPILPPHLLQIILNQEVPDDSEPSMLPEPSHVMLNHLYALSIKDGVMVLSSTQRYRQKYVTTVFYKPIADC